MDLGAEGMVGPRGVMEVLCMPLAMEISGNLSQDFVRMAEGNEVASAVDGMPDGSGGFVRHRAVDGFRHQFVIRTPPEIDRRGDCAPVEGSGFLEHGGVNNKTS